MLNRFVKAAKPTSLTKVGFSLASIARATPLIKLLIGGGGGIAALLYLAFCFALVHGITTSVQQRKL